MIEVGNCRKINFLLRWDISISWGSSLGLETESAPKSFLLLMASLLAEVLWWKLPLLSRKTFYLHLEREKQKKYNRELFPRRLEVQNKVAARMRWKNSKCWIKRWQAAKAVVVDLLCLWPIPLPILAAFIDLQFSIRKLFFSCCQHS